MVEHPPPGRYHPPPPKTNHQRIDAGGIADHAGRVLALLGGGRAHSLAMHYSGKGAERFPLRRSWSVTMNWPDLSMGGYGFYVWGSYLFSLIAIVWEVVSLRARKKALAQQQSSNTVSASVLRERTNETTS